MGLSATINSVAQHHSPGYPLQRAHGPLSEKDCCATRNGVAPAPPPKRVTILRDCRCIDCSLFHYDEFDQGICDAGIGGTAVVWATGEQVCTPPPDEWHYCARYRGPQVSMDVWVWSRRSHHVCAGSTIAREVEQPDEYEVLI